MMVKLVRLAGEVTTEDANPRQDNRREFRPSVEPGSEDILFGRNKQNSTHPRIETFRPVNSEYKSKELNSLTIDIN
jgi:hypothetical protein